MRSMTNMAELSADERALRLQVRRCWDELPGIAQEEQSWFDVFYSIDAISNRRRRANGLALSSGYEYVQTAAENEPFFRLCAAVEDLLREEVPWSSRSDERMHHARRVLFAARLIWDPDLEWHKADLGENQAELDYLPRAWVWREITGDDSRRGRWNDLVRGALEEVCSEPGGIRGADRGRTETPSKAPGADKPRHPTAQGAMEVILSQPANKPISHKEIWAELKARGITVGLDRVQRVVGVLKKEGIVHSQKGIGVWHGDGQASGDAPLA